MTDTRCALVAIVGRPNVGKSTLLNHLLGQKLSITSRKPQTTRQQLLGVRTEGASQLIFIDTPGIHIGQPKAMNKLMNKSAASAMTEVDVTFMLCDRTRWTEEDALALQWVSRREAAWYCHPCRNSPGSAFSSGSGGRAPWYTSRQLGHAAYPSASRVCFAALAATVLVA